MTREQPAVWRAYGVLLFGQLAVGSAAILARAGLDAGFSPFALAAWRLTFAAAILLAGGVVLAKRRCRGAYGQTNKPTLRSPAAPLLPLILAGICLGLHFAAWFASLQRIPVAQSTLLVATTPLWAGLAGILILKHRLPRSFWIGLAVAGAGIYLVTRSGPVRPPMIAGQAVAGNAMALAGAVFIAAYLLLVEPVQKSLGIWRLISFTYSFAAITIWPVALFATGGHGATPDSGAVWLSALGMALVPQLLGHTSMNWALRHFPAGIVGAATLLEPVIAAVLAWWILSEPITRIQALGAVVLLAGVALALARPRSSAEPMELVR